MPPRSKAAPVSEAMDETDELSADEQAELTKQSGEEAPAAAPPPEPEAAKPAEEAAPPKAEKKHERAIPYERFDELNQLNKQLKQQLEELNPVREKWARLEERQKMAAEARAAQEQAEAEIKRRQEEPDPNIDPVGHRAWKAEQMALQAQQANALLQQQMQQFIQQRQQVDQNTEMNMWLAYQVPLARSTVPDYDARVDYARQTRAGMWSKVYDMPDGRKIQLFNEDDARKITEGEEIVLTSRARQMGIPLHMVVQTLAESWGYKPADTNGAVANGAAPRQVTPQAVLPNGAEKLEQIQKGQAVQGLGRTQSGEAPAAAGWQTMSNDEFKAYVGNMAEDTYIEMVRDPRFGKQFERRVSMIDMVE